jgi:hypothetical protein
MYAKSECWRIVHRLAKGRRDYSSLRRLPHVVSDDESFPSEVAKLLTGQLGYFTEL